MAKKKRQHRPKAKRHSKIGLAPGTLIFTGVQKMTTMDVTCIQYSDRIYEEIPIDSLETLFKTLEKPDVVSWVNIDGIHDTTAIEKIATHFNIHKLTTEDVLSVGQRPKLDEHHDYLHVVLKMFMLDNTDNTLEDEQLSFILKDRVLLSFQERTGDVFEGVRKRIKEGKGFIRSRGADYLLYALMDSVVDHYFMILETFGDKMETIENELLENPTEDILAKVHDLRRETSDLRRSVYPLREVINKFEKIAPPMLQADIQVFVRDLYDHTIQVIETIEVFRETASSLLDLYMNSVSNRMNEIMKVLTIMASIFIPLTFIAGVYGMNFDHMPELHYKYGYFMVWGVMILVFIGLLIYFKRKKWL